MRSAAPLGAALVDLVLPRTCAGCGVPGAVLCRSCAVLLAQPQLATPRPFPWGFSPPPAPVADACAIRPRVVAVTEASAGPRGPVVGAFKERGRAELARPLGTALALAVAAVVAGVPDAGPVLL